MPSALFAINPEFVEKIFSNEKLYEYRKLVCKQKIDKIIIYETAPVSKIVGEVAVIEVLQNTPELLWSKTSKYSGISADFFFDYFDGKKTAYAYVLKNPKRYKTSIYLDDLNISAAPQSFIYLTEKQCNLLIQ